MSQQRPFNPAAAPQAGYQNRPRFGGSNPGVAPGQRPAFGVGERSQGPPQRFGGSNSGVASGQRPAFGVGERSQGTPQRFGGGGERSPHFGATEAGPRRSPSGREFVYHGQHFARFAGPHYHWPHGGRYHRYAVGYRLPRDYFIRDYYIDDYDDYGLASPPPDFEWIRYGPDILLVDLDTGEIAQTVYGAFDEVDDSDAPPPDGDPDQ